MTCFHVHNAFRSPGGLRKASWEAEGEVYRGRYENFRHGLKSSASSSIRPQAAESRRRDVLRSSASTRDRPAPHIFDLLIAKSIPFIDVGMGLDRKRGPINGMVRADLLFCQKMLRQLRDKGLAEMSDQPDDIYRTNIQIGEINALNACLGVIPIQTTRGFYSKKLPITICCWRSAT